MNVGKHGFSRPAVIDRERAAEIASDYIRMHNKGGTIDVSEVEETSGLWAVRGSCSKDERDYIWAEDFEIFVERRGNVKSAEFGLRHLKNDDGLPLKTDTKPTLKEVREETKLGHEGEKLQDQPPQDHVQPPVSNSFCVQTENCSVQEETDSGELIKMDSVEQTAKRINALETTKKQLILEREILRKKVADRASSLEGEIKDMESEIRSMKQLLDGETAPKNAS